MIIWRMTFKVQAALVAIKVWKLFSQNWLPFHGSAWNRKAAALGWSVAFASS